MITDYSGNALAFAFVGGSCRLCETCNVKAGICIHPTRVRIPQYAVGINMKKTAERAGMPIRFPAAGHPEPMAIPLVDLKKEDPFLEILFFPEERWIGLFP
jgi:predicted metal-binding protein